MGLLDEYSQVLISAADNVGSKQVRTIHSYAGKTGDKDFEKLLPVLVVHFHHFAAWVLCCGGYLLLLNLVYCLCPGEELNDELLFPYWFDCRNDGILLLQTF